MANIFPIPVIPNNLEIYNKSKHPHHTKKTAGPSYPAVLVLQIVDERREQYYTSTISTLPW